MADYTIKAYVQWQAANKQGLAPVYVRYYYNKKQSTYPLGVSVKERYWNDAGQGAFRANGPNAAENNTKLQLYISVLDQVAACFEQPLWLFVKPQFEATLLLLRQELVKRSEHQAARKEKAQVLSAEVEEKIRLHQRELEKLGMQQEVIARSYEQELASADAKVLMVDEEAYQLFHEQAKLYIKQFRGKAKTGKHKILFQDNTELLLDMDVPAHLWYKVLLDFEKYTGYRCTFANIDRTFYNRYTDYLWDVKDYEDASHFNHVSRLRMFLSDSLSLGFTVNLFYKHKSFKLYKKAKPILALTEEELDALWRTDFENKKLNKVRNIFCFQSFTGLRYSDAQKKNEVRNGRVVGITGTQKTDGNYSIPLVLYADNRLEELLVGNLSMDSKGYRLGIKQMMQLFFTVRGEAQRLVDVYKYKRGELLRQVDGTLPTEPIWEAFSSHNARKTFCTIMFLKGYTVEMVAKMIGSKRQDVLRDNYIGFIDSDLDKMIKNAEDEKILRARVIQQEAELAELRKMLPSAEGQ